MAFVVQNFKIHKVTVNLERQEWAKILERCNKWPLVVVLREKERFKSGLYWR